MYRRKIFYLRRKGEKERKGRERRKSWRRKNTDKKMTRQVVHSEFTVRSFQDTTSFFKIMLTSVRYWPY